ncbi:MAG: hypothetical protein FWB93_00325 [Oscillospiraceae bacterium]|nr:hypothetical protein [Oscillospiraceae bacterium]
MAHFFDLLIEYFGFGTGSIDTTAAMIVWGIYIGIVIASAVALYQKNVVGRFVRSIIAENATSPETAKTLEELGYGKKYGIRRHLRGKTALSSIIFEAEDELVLDDDGLPRPVVRSSVNLANGKFYIPEDLKHRAQVRFEKKGSSIWSFLLVVVVFFVMAIGVVQLLPWFLGVLENFLYVPEGR